jgi:aspartate aminotransferase
MLSERVRRIGMSATLKVSSLAMELRSKGIDVLNFSVGEPDMPTADAVKRAGHEAIDADKTRYTPNPGVPELRRAVADKLRRENDLEYAPEQVLVSPGAKASLYFASMALFDAGDDVLIPSPYWVSFPEQVKLAGARPVIVPTDESSQFKVTPEILRNSVTPATRGIILNYPSNPTGASYERAELEALASVFVERDLVVIADEIYEKLVYDGRAFTSIAAVSPEMKARTVVVNGVSKAYCMTGWRIGYAAGPKEIITAMGRVQSHSTSNATSISQWASIEALKTDPETLAGMVREFEGRRDEVIRALAAFPGVQCSSPAGAFYVFPNVAAVLGRSARGRTIATAEDMAVYLLEEARVAVVPGEAFGAPGNIRISYAASIDQIREGMTRIGEALSALK